MSRISYGRNALKGEPMSTGRRLPRLTKHVSLLGPINAFFSSLVLANVAHSALISLACIVFEGRWMKGEEVWRADSDSSDSSDWEW